MVERGAPFVQGPSFFRAESIFNRDLGVLSAILHRRQLPTPDYSVLDLFAGSGVRGLRYLQQAGATHVHCNDRNERLNGVLTANLEAAALKMTGPCTTEEVDLPGLVGSTARVWRKEGQPTAPPVCTLTHLSAEKLMLWHAATDAKFDLIDCDSFGAPDSTVSLSLQCVRHGGLLVATSTAGMIGAGRDPEGAAAFYSAHVAPVPYANEQALRLLIGFAARQAMSLRLDVTPLWSLFSGHGPVFKTMLLVTPCTSSAELQRSLGYVLHSPGSGQNRVVAWQDLVSAAATHSDSPECVASGPLWTGQLHDAAHLAAMRQEAEQLGWLSAAGDAATSGLPVTKKGAPVANLGALLDVLAGEADPALPPWHLHLTDLARWCNLPGAPPRDALLRALHRDGIPAVKTHFTPRAIKTSATMEQLAQAANSLESWVRPLHLEQTLGRMGCVEEERMWRRFSKAALRPES